jgi:small subunit ribosomal protein S5
MAKRQQNQRQDREESEFEEKVLFINRCSKVVKGGRKFSFSALILVGDGKGKVGFGFAKANELTDAIRKGGEAGKKALISFEREGTSIPHQIQMDWDGATVLLKPAPEGTGVIAGSRIRAVLEMAGVKDVVAKNLGSSNPLNQVRATFKALMSLRNREKTKQLRGLA